MTDFNGAVVTLFESRRAAELASLVRRHGGEPYGVPSVAETPVLLGAEHRRVLAELAAYTFDVAVLLTGVGVELLLGEARRLGTLPTVSGVLQQMTTISRGPKPSRVLRSHGIVPRYLVDAPHTTTKLRELLTELPLWGRRVLIVTAGEPVSSLTAFLRAQRAEVTELQLYRWELTAGARDGLARAIGRIVSGQTDAVAFTTQVQVRHLFQVAAERESATTLRDALRHRVVVGAVGPTCADALRRHGVEPHVVPEHGRMGQLVLALAEGIEARRSADRPAVSAHGGSSTPNPSVTTAAATPATQGAAREVAGGSESRIPSEWLAALAIVVAAAGIRAQFGSGILTATAVLGLFPLVAVYWAIGAVRRLGAARPLASGSRMRRAALLAWLIVVPIPLPFLLFARMYGLLPGASALAADQGIGLAIGGYVIALLESVQLLLWLSAPARPAGLA